MTLNVSGKKLEDGLGLSGKGRLTITRIDTIQSFYGKAIRDNKGSASDMAKATHAILKHYSSSPDNPCHDDCPKGASSWCSYNRDKATASNQHVPIKNPLPPAVVKVMEPIFNRLGDKHFLVGSEKCLTQNTNESLHHVIWSMAPKEQYTSQQEVSLAVALGVLIFNNGFETTMEKLMEKTSLPFQPCMVSTWETIDHKRMLCSYYKSKEDVKKKLNRRKREKAKKQDAFVHDEGVSYSSQKFYATSSATKRK